MIHKSTLIRGDRSSRSTSARPSPDIKGAPKTCGCPSCPSKHDIRRGRRSRSRGRCPGNDTYQSRRSRSRGRPSGTESFSYIEKLSKEPCSSDADTESLCSSYGGRPKRYRESRKNSKLNPLAQNKGHPNSNAVVKVAQPCTSTFFKAEDSELFKKRGMNACEPMSDFCSRTLGGVERWLLKNEKGLSVGDCTALSPDRKGPDEDPPIEQLLNCALQLYHWGRIHGSSGTVIWDEHPSDVRKVINNAILELGSHDAQHELILRMRYNPSRSSFESKHQYLTQDVYPRESAIASPGERHAIPVPKPNSCADLLTPRSNSTSLASLAPTTNSTRDIVAKKAVIPQTEAPSQSQIRSLRLKAIKKRFWDQSYPLNSDLDPGFGAESRSNSLPTSTLRTGSLGNGDREETPALLRSRGSTPPLIDFDGGLINEGSQQHIEAAQFLDLSNLSLLSGLSPQSAVSKGSAQQPVFSTTCAAKPQGYSISSSSLEDDDDDEEIGKLSASLLYLIYLGLGYGKYSFPRVSGRELARSSENRCDSGIIRCSNPGVKSTSPESDQSKRGKKHSRRDSDDEGDEKDLEPPRRKKKLMSADEINQRFACPFAKGNPAQYSKCVFVHRRDLPGVRLVKDHRLEHLKRNHYGGVVPLKIRQARTWSQIFIVCNPDWPVGVPIPSPHVDINQLHVSSQTISTPPTTVPMGALLASAMGQPQPIAPSESRTRMDRLSLQPSSAPIYGTMGLPSPSAGTNQLWGNSQTSPNVQTAVPQSFEPQTSQSIFSTGSMLPNSDNVLDFDILTQFFEDSAQWIINNCNPQSTPDRGASLQEDPDAASTSSSASDIGIPILTPRSSHESLSDALMRDNYNSVARNEFNELFETLSGSNDRGRTNTLPEPAQGSVIGSRGPKKHLLCVARKPALPKSLSSETSSSKKFYFDNIEEFEAQFENWMKTQFHDPAFCWGFWELENPERQERLCSTREVMDALEFMWLAHRSNDAALYLVAKRFDGLGWGEYP
ncbi:hypothetical protein TWF730_002998 [Orbilia blumenaviensis]|uniref:Uncharacterized protein n=1 Tax=Orbilia blumenaviensis TaxID=1796055 RepID=A0AAV9U8F2_9PEZI